MEGATGRLYSYSENEAQPRRAINVHRRVAVDLRDRSRVQFHLTRQIVYPSIYPPTAGTLSLFHWVFIFFHRPTKAVLPSSRSLRSTKGLGRGREVPGLRNLVVTCAYPSVGIRRGGGR